MSKWAGRTPHYMVNVKAKANYEKTQGKGQLTGSYRMEFGKTPREPHTYGPKARRPLSTQRSVQAMRTIAPNKGATPRNRRDIMCYTTIRQWRTWKWQVTTKRKPNQNIRILGSHHLVSRILLVEMGGFGVQGDKFHQPVRGEINQRKTIQAHKSNEITPNSFRGICWCKK